VTNSVIEAINRSGILPKDRILEQGCYVDVSGWVGPGRLMLSAYGRQPNVGGFEVVDFPCLWDIDKGTFTFTPVSPATLPKVNNFENDSNKESSKGGVTDRKTPTLNAIRVRSGLLPQNFNLHGFLIAVFSAAISIRLAILR
jgi:hypothetical protein